MATGIRATAVADAALRAREGSERMAKEWAAVLQQVPLFQSLSRRHLRRVAGCARTRRFERGSAIVRAGQPGSAFYVVLEGEASVATRRGRGVRLRAGDSFGEMALLDGAPRSADVVAVGDVVAMEIGRTAFARLLKQEPQIALALLRTLAQRVRRLEE
jgi:CRP-like cAMP-binding protein